MLYRPCSLAAADDEDDDDDDDEEEVELAAVGEPSSLSRSIAWRISGVASARASATFTCRCLERYLLAFSPPWPSNTPVENYTLQSKQLEHGQGSEQLSK